MKHQLIIVDGQSTVGKSSVSKALYKQLAENETVYWLHEECEKHPIRDQEFEAGDIHTVEGMELNRIQMLNKWVAFRNQIQDSGKLCITEGCFLHAMDRYLLESVWSDKEIKEYFTAIVEILKPLNPLIIFLYRLDIKQSFEKAFTSRGGWWKDMVLGVPEPYGYFEHHTYDGDDSIFQGLAYEQDKMKQIYDTLTCDKMMIDTSDEEWTRYLRDIVEKLGCSYQKESESKIDEKKYCGTYRRQDGTGTWKIYSDQKNHLVSSVFWPYMPMEYVGNGCFELISFPIKLIFDTANSVPQFVVEGNYDWDLNGVTFIRIDE